MDWKAYIEQGGVSCPYCGSPDLYVQSHHYDETGTCYHVDCGGCGKSWTDIHKLAEVSEHTE